MSFLKQYQVQYWTKDGALTSIIIGAMNVACAIDIANSMPNFEMLAGYPEEC